MLPDHPARMLSYRQSVFVHIDAFIACFFQRSLVGGPSVRRHTWPIQAPEIPRRSQTNSKTKARILPKSLSSPWRSTPQARSPKQTERQRPKPEHCLEVLQVHGDQPLRPAGVLNKQRDNNQSENIASKSCLSCCQEGLFHLFAFVYVLHCL